MTTGRRFIFFGNRTHDLPREFPVRSPNRTGKTHLNSFKNDFESEESRELFFCGFDSVFRYDKRTGNRIFIHLIRTTCLGDWKGNSSRLPFAATLVVSILHDSNADPSKSRPLPNRFNTSPYGGHAALSGEWKRYPSSVYKTFHSFV